MKFYAHANENCNYKKAISLEKIRSIQLVTGDGKSAIRFSVVVYYEDGNTECFDSLLKEEAEQVFSEILEAVRAEA